MAEEIPIAPAGGLNQSDSSVNASDDSAGHSLFEAGDYRYMSNLHNGRSNTINEGAAENFRSTLAVSSYYQWNGSDWVVGSAPAGTNNARGKYEDHTEGKVYWAMQNSDGHDAILMFVKSERKIYELIQWDDFNFSTNFVSMAKINKFLIFTDGNPDDETGMPPRMIDVTTIFVLKATLSTSFSEYHVSFVKWAPVAPAQVLLSGLADNVFIARGIYQFSYRYIYTGGFRSCFAPPSNFVTNEQRVAVNPDNPTPLSSPAINFSVVARGWLFNYNNPSDTAFTHGNGMFYDFIESIEYAYRESSTSNWKVFSRQSVNGVAPPSAVIFANSGPIVNVAEAEIGQYFDAVPLLSRSVEAIDNRPMLGNNLDDLPPMEDFAVTDIAVYSVQNTDDNWFNDVSGLSSPLSLRRMSFKENGIYKLGIIFKDYSGRSGLVQTLDEWTYTIPVNNETAELTIEDFHALGFKIASGIKPPIWAVDYQIVRSNCLNIEMFIIGMVNDYKFLMFDVSATSNASIATSDEIKTAIAGYYDNFNNGASQYSLISRVLSSVRKNQLAPTFDRCTLIYIDISNWYLDTSYYTGAPPFPPQPSNNVYYNWQPGDRVRFWGSTDLTFTPTTVWTQFDEEIIQFTGTALIVSKPNELKTLQMRSYVTSDRMWKPYQLEVYRPRKYTTKNDVIFYEMGEWYPVLEPTTSNRDFSKKDFTWNGSSQVTSTTLHNFTYYNKFPIVNGDVWAVTKNFFWNYQSVALNGLGWIDNNNIFYSNIKDYPIFPQMTQDKNNAAGVWEHNNGRPLPAYRYLPKQFNKSTQVRFGGKFLEDSLFIGINNFQEGNQYIYPSEYGPIRAMVNVSNVVVKAMGNILLVLGEEEAWSVYVNRTTLQDLGGQGLVSLSDKVLGSFNTLLGSYGALNPESVSRRNSRVIFWSVKQGKWVRYSDDGLTPISDRKMYNWFSDLSNLLQPSYSTDTPARAITVFDNYYEEWLTYLEHADLPSTFRGYASYKGCSFSEDDKRWKTFYDFAAEFFAALENEVYSIVGSTIHIHYAGTDYGSFYGVKKDCYWQPVANQEFRRKKIWKAVGLEATDKWSFPAIDGDFRSNGALIQTTNISLTDLVELEGVFWSDIPRDTNTLNRTGDDALRNGNVMRSKALTLMLKLDPAVVWYSFVNWVMASEDVSQKTLKK